MGITDKKNLSSSDLTTLKGRIKHIRGLKTQSEFADYLGLDRSAIVRYENGKIPSGEFFMAIATKTDWNIYWLATGKGNEKIETMIKMSNGVPVLEWNKFFGPNSLAENNEKYMSLKGDVKIIDVFSKISSDVPSHMWKNGDFSISLSHHFISEIYTKLFGFIIPDDSMLPRYKKGDVVIATETDLSSTKPGNKDIVITIFDTDNNSSSPNVKLINWIDNEKTQFILKSINPDFVDTVHHLKNVKRMFKVYLTISEVKLK